MARAEAHGQTLDLAIKGGDPSLGFTAPEALLAAFGACILSGITRDAAERCLRIDHAEVVFDGVKHLDPLRNRPARLPGDHPQPGAGRCAVGPVLPRDHRRCGDQCAPPRPEPDRGAGHRAGRRGGANSRVPGGGRSMKSDAHVQGATHD